MIKKQISETGTSVFSEFNPLSANVLIDVYLGHKNDNI